jgi:membrane-associated protease RseP (regulator of RpoE activity)
MTNNLIVSRGAVETQTAIQSSVVFANGDVTARTGLYSVVIVCDGDVHLTDDFIAQSLIIARGDIRAKRGATASTLIAGGRVVLEEKMRTGAGRHNEIKENESNPLGYITFFELSTVGLEVKVADRAVSVAKVAEGKPFVAAGLRPGDVITAIDGKRPDSAGSLRRLLRDALALGDATVTLKRGDATHTVKVSLPE